MKNTLLLFFLSLLILSHFSYGNNFIIKLATYSNKDRLYKQISRLNDTVQKSIILIEEEHLYKLFSQSLQNKKEALRLLPQYRKVFPDAYIMEDKYTHKEKKSIDIALALQEASRTYDPTIKIDPTGTVLQPLKQHTPKVSFQNLLQNQTFYLCPHKITAPSEKILIQADFSDTHIHYTTLIGKVPSLEMDYMIKNNRLYIINNNRISISQFSTIDKILFEYMIVSRWMKGKKIHQMRYYKKEADARSYINSIENL